MPLRNSLLALVMLLLTVAGPVAASTGAATLDAKEASQLVRATIVLSDTGAASLFAADVTVVGRLDRLGLLTVEATPERLAELKASGAIEGYSVARPLHLFLDESTIAVEANLVNVQGHTGAGAAVVVIDSGVDLVAARVADNSGAIMSPDVLDALNWVLTVAETHNIVAVNLSLGTDVDPGPCRNVAWEAAIAALADAGVAVVAASGNSASAGLLPVAFPACLPGVFSVGATERSPGIGLAQDSTPELTGFTQYEGTLDIVAPGFDIMSGVTPGSGFASLDGTSMAAPHVAGAFALLAGTQTK